MSIRGAFPSPKVIAIFGPTGSGKTEVAVELAGLLSGHGARSVAINCDSMQVYRGMEVLTGAPTPTQRRQLEHRLVGMVSPEDEFSAGEFGRLAHDEIDSALEGGVWPLLVGGTGLYMRSALTDLELRPVIPDGTRESIEREMERLGPEALHARLPGDVANWVEPADRKRIARYLGLIEAGHRPAPPTSEGGELWDAPFRRPTLPVGLVLDREELRDRVERRVRRMADEGAVEEARRLLASGASRTAVKAIGLREFADRDLEGAARGHLALARRQTTWLRRSPGLAIIDRGGLTDREVAGMILERLQAESGRDA